MQKSDFEVWRKSFQVNRKNRDRIGGHKCNLDHEWSKCYRKKFRRQHTKAIALGLQDYQWLVNKAQIEEWDEASDFEEFFEADSYYYAEEDNSADLEYDYGDPDDYTYFGMDDFGMSNVFYDPDYPEDLDRFMDRFDDFLKS